MPPKKSDSTDPVPKAPKRAKITTKPDKKSRPVSKAEKPSRVQEHPPSVEVHESRGTVLGNFNNVVNNFIQAVDEKLLKRIGLEQRTGFFLLGFLLIGGFAGVYLGLRQPDKNIMTGEFRIAVASFAENGKALPRDLGYTIADGINIRLSDDLQEITGGPKVTIWGPDKVGVIKGTTVEERAEKAEELAKKIQAHMVIYGAVTSTPDGMLVIPEFYLDKQGFHQGSEVTGQYALGAAFPLPGADNPAWQFNFDKQMQLRTDIISSLAEGLSYLAVYEYDTALERLQSIESVEGWNDDQGKEVLYALIGFAAGKAGQYDLTRESLEKAISLNQEYARPYIGLANLSYVLAIKPFEESKNVADVNQDLLQQCFTYLDLAVQAPLKPPLADVETKIHFSRGQCYWLMTYSDQLADYSLSIQEFQQVINAYDDGNNPRVREEAGESHARLGLIATLMGDVPGALSHYQEAVILLSDNPERQTVYQKRVDTLKKSLLTTTP